MSTRECHQVKGTRFEFPELPPEEPMRSRYRQERAALLAKAAKVNAKVKPGERTYTWNSGAHPLAKRTTILDVPLRLPCGDSVRWAESGGECEGVVWSPGPLPSSVWVLTDRGAVALRVDKGGVWTIPTYDFRKDA